MSETQNASVETDQQRKWTPLPTIERRVLGVLVEKAKTTPDNYPLSLNALTNGCNQKSNRDPQMSLEPDQVEEALERLRGVNAVAEVQGEGRVPKYRHYAYDWLGVDKLELAVMAELLLRGAQTVGELRGRAARMDPIPDLAALKPVIDSLIAKGLVISLTPPGRGQIVTHSLYLPEQLEKVKQAVASGDHMPPSSKGPSSGDMPATDRNQTSQASVSSSELDVLKQEVEQLKSEVARLKGEVNDLWSNVGRS